jgi:hypothetical protein
VLVLDGAGKIVAEFRFDHTASGWALCQEKLAHFPQVAIAVEAGHSAAIERLVTLNYLVYPVHPRSSKSYRTRRLPSGTKTDCSTRAINFNMVPGYCSCSRSKSSKTKARAERTGNITAVGRLVLCKAFLAPLRSALTAPPAAVGWPLGFCFRKIVPGLGVKMNNENR